MKEVNSGLGEGAEICFEVWLALGLKPHWLSLLNYLTAPAAVSLGLTLQLCWAQEWLPKQEAKNWKETPELNFERVVVSWLVHMHNIM